mgnify:CR=1 FL=1
MSERMTHPIICDLLDLAEVSALGLLEPLNDRIRRDNARLQWEDVLPQVKNMGQYLHHHTNNAEDDPDLTGDSDNSDISTTGGGDLKIEFLMFDADPFVPIIRLDLLEKHGFALPNTWQELVDFVTFINGTDINDDGDASNDWGICHFPRFGSGLWDWWFSEVVYATWATYEQTQGTQEGFFFDPHTMEPRFGLSDSFREAAKIWRELWPRGTSSETDVFLEGRCAVGFGPPGSWKRVFLTPHGVHRSDPNNASHILWQPKMKNGEYAEPYRFQSFGSTQVHDRTTGQLVTCTPQLCPKAKPIPKHGHFVDPNDKERIDRTAVLPPSPLEGQWINRAPFFWSGGLGTCIRKSSPKVRKDLMWDFFVYANSPACSVYDVANYRSWLDSWRYSHVQAPGTNFIQAGWSQDAYEEHANVQRWTVSKDTNSAFNLRLPGLAKYTHEIVGQNIKLYFNDALSLDDLMERMTKGWIDITRQEGKLEQLEIYRSSLGLPILSNVDLCRLHRALMDEKDPSVCRKYDATKNNPVLLFILIPVVLVLVAVLILLYLERKRKKESDLVWNIDPSELHFQDPPRILGQGTFGFVLKAEYR